MRKPLIAGNWKMNLNHLEAIAVTQKLAYSLDDRDYDAVEVVVIPPFTDIRSVQTLIDGDRLRLLYGAQDISTAQSGAFTGEISGAMLAKLGCTYVLVGHSERRTNHKEDDELLNRKIKAVFANELKPILCVGEELSVREAGTHVAYVLTQLRNALKGLHKPDLKKIVVAYDQYGQLELARLQPLRMHKRFVLQLGKSFVKLAVMRLQIIVELFMVVP